MNNEENFWKGEFGDEYSDRNQGKVESNTAFFARALQRTSGIKRLIEFGAGTGQNMLAISRLLPDADMIGVEINEKAAQMIPVGNIIRGSIFDFAPSNYDRAQLSMTKGLLIHIAPEDLPRIYDLLVCSTLKYLLIAEYYSPKPREIEYQGSSNKLWARDFAGEIMRTHRGVELIDYGFVYHRDPNFPQDDLTWFLMERK